MIRFLLIFLLALPILGYAETIPLPNISQPAKIYWRTDSVEFNPDVSGPLGQSPEAFCQQIYTAKGYTYSSFAMGSGSLGLCSGTAGGWNRQVSIQRRYKCSETSTDSSTTPTTCTISACPDATWTQEGNSCTRPDCPAGFDRGADGQCLKDCTGKRGMSTVNNGYEFVGAVSNWSVGGCRVRCDQRVLASGGGMGYSCKFTGASASPDNPEAEALPPDPKELPPEEPKDCLGKGQGFIKSSTGKITCVPASDAPAGNKPDAVESDSVKEKGKPGEDGYSKEEKTNSSDKDGNTTTTKKETIPGTSDGNGGVTCPSGYVKNADNTCTKTTTEKQTTKGFCEENPNSAVCKGVEDTCKDNPERLGCMKAGEVPNEGGLVSSEFGISSISPVSLAASHICPQGPPLPHGWGYFSFDGICQLATGIRPVVLAMAWLAAGLILMGAFRES